MYPFGQRILWAPQSVWTLRGQEFVTPTEAFAPVH